jgi:hypothetical protein
LIPVLIVPGCHSVGFHTNACYSKPFFYAKEGVKQTIREKRIWRMKLIVYLIKKRIIKVYEASTESIIKAYSLVLDIKIKIKEPKNFITGDANNPLVEKPFVLSITVF